MALLKKTGAIASAVAFGMAAALAGCGTDSPPPPPGAAADASTDAYPDGATAEAEAASDAAPPDATLDAGADGAGEAGADGGDAEAAGPDASPPDAGPDAQTFAVTVTAVDTTFDTRDHFIASVEMQLSGEPFAESMGRDLGGYSRDFICQDPVCQASVYYDPATTTTGLDGGPVGGVIDVPGFASAVESYEYSKQPMNNIAFESGAGTSLLFGPVLNPAGVTGTDALALAQAWIGDMAGGSNATSRFVKVFDNAANPLGWPGFWPTLQPFTSWDPAIQPTHDAGCSISSDDDPGAKGALTCDDYECDYSTLHLPNRAGQVSSAIGPGASGWVGWKEALWTLNYLQVMHDSQEIPVNTVAPLVLGSVGVPGNDVTGSLHPGVYLGSSDIEGFQAGNFITILDNEAQQWLTQLTTADGATLGGFSTIADALAYSTTSPLRWFPTTIQVTEQADPSGFPMPSAYAITDGTSGLLDEAGLLGAFSSIYALTDQDNGDVGGSQPVQAYFDGDPFPVQNQTPDGEPTLHDRALAMMRVVVVNMDRLHVDPTTGIFVDQSSVAAGAPVRGTTLSADVAAYTLLSLRTVRRALDSELTLYSNTKPDTAGIPSPLDTFPAVDGVAFSTRLDQLIAALSDVFYNQLTTADGHAYAGWNVASAAATDTGTSLDAHTAAIRGLLVAYLATGSPKYRTRAQAVFARVEAAFYDPTARLYRPVEGDHSLTVTFTPRRFGLLQAMLRDMYELVAVLPGNDALAALVLDRVGRLDKIVLNGWDDRDGDQLVEWPSECAHLGTGPDGQPLGLGGLQMAERVLTGESGSATDVFDAGSRVVATDREHDCVPEISAVGLPAALANSVTLTLTPWTPAQQGQVLQDGGWVTP
jgi:hypothetical protein